MSLTQLTRRFEVCGGVCSSSVCLRACAGGGGGGGGYTILANPPGFPGKSTLLPGISSKLPEKSQFHLMQDFPENSMDST